MLSISTVDGLSLTLFDEDVEASGATCYSFPVPGLGLAFEDDLVATEAGCLGFFAWHGTKLL